MSSANGWRVVKFGDIVRQVKDSVDPDSSGLERYVAGEHMDTDEIRIGPLAVCPASAALRPLR
jgi:type I restriction enzyme S subunit